MFPLQPRRDRRGLTLAACLALALLTLSPLAHADAWGLGDLMRALSQTRTAKAQFTERKYIGFLDQPVESSGELSFQAPDRLEKRTLLPKPEFLAVDGERLVVEQAGKRRMVVSLRSQPEATAFVESVRATLAGDQAALERFYTVELQGRADAWRLTLTPRQDNMRKVIQRIRMEGARTDITAIAFDQADGDRSEMRITRVDAP